MAVHTDELRLSTEGDVDVVDITAEVQAIVGNAGIAEGQALAFVIVQVLG